MERPSIAQLKMKNPEFFGDHWDRLYSGNVGEIIPNPDGGWFFVAPGVFKRPFYYIAPDLTLSYSHHEE